MNDFMPQQDRLPASVSEHFDAIAHIEPYEKLCGCGHIPHSAVVLPQRRASRRLQEAGDPIYTLVNEAACHLSRDI